MSYCIPAWSICSLPCSDDEDEGETNDAATEVPSAEGDGVRVKEEPTDDVQPKKRAGTPSNELHVYTVEELSKFRKKELLADVTLLEGTYERYGFPSTC